MYMRQMTEDGTRSGGVSVSVQACQLPPTRTSLPAFNYAITFCHVCMCVRACVWGACVRVIMQTNCISSHWFIMSLLTEAIVWSLAAEIGRGEGD
jgi:hypothetical protein